MSGGKRGQRRAHIASLHLRLDWWLQDSVFYHGKRGPIGWGTRRPPRPPLVPPPPASCVGPRPSRGPANATEGRAAPLRGLGRRPRSAHEG